MPSTIAILPIDLHYSRLGLPSRLTAMLAGRTVLEHTLQRLSRCTNLTSLVLVHPADQDVASLVQPWKLPKPLHLFPCARFLKLNPIPGAGSDSSPPVSAPPEFSFGGISRENSGGTSGGGEHSGGGDHFRGMRIAARKWSLTAWRGGLGGMTVFDELLPAGPLLAAAKDRQASSVLLAGGDWPLIDPQICDQMLRLHLDQPESISMTFSQAPPGLAGVVLAVSLLEQMAENHSTFGRMLAYHPSKPQGDPIGKDVCIQVPSEVRHCAKRFIYDTPRSCALIEAIATQLGDHLPLAITTADVNSSPLPIPGAGEGRVRGPAHTPPSDQSPLTPVTPVSGFGKSEIRNSKFEISSPLPQQVTLELTPRRSVSGPLTPQHYLKLDRPDFGESLAHSLFTQLASVPDLVLTFAGLGDPLLHPRWWEIIHCAAASGVFGLALETDLLCTTADIDRLLELPLDVISIHLNADTAAVYAKVMGRDAFATVAHNLEHLINSRNRRTAQIESATSSLTPNPQPLTPPPSSPTPHTLNPTPFLHLPWIIPRLLKSADTLPDLESFFDKWVYYCNHAVISSPSTGCGLIPDLAIINMAPGQRFPCRQLERRLTILSDGRVALCDQDWLGRACIGDIRTTPLADLWQLQLQTIALHRAANWDSLPLCSTCHEWHRP